MGVRERKRKEPASCGDRAFRRKSIADERDYRPGGSAPAGGSDLCANY